MFFLSFLLVFLASRFSSAELVSRGNCNINFGHRLFSNPPFNNGSKSFGHITKGYTREIPSYATILIPLFKDNFNTPVSILIYKKGDSRFISNLPKDVSNVESWDDSFGICTQEDIDLGKCDNVGEFKLELKDHSVKNKIVNKLFHFDKDDHGVLNRFLIELEVGTFCYISVFEEDTMAQISNGESGKESENKNMKNGVTFSSIHNSRENTVGFLQYYGYIFLLVIQFILGIFLWQKIKSDERTSSINYKLELFTPYKFCFAIIIISFFISLFHLYYTNLNLTAIEGRIFDQDQMNVIRLIRKVDDIFETVGEILVYLICFQFINLDRFGIKISLSKNRYGYLFISVLVWTLIIHPFIIDYRYKILFAIEKSAPFNKISMTDRPISHSRLVNTILRECVEVFNLLNYITIWFILYKTSQNSEVKFLSDNAKSSEYAQRFKSTRIWLIFSSIVFKIFGFIFGRFVYKFVWKFIEYIQTKLEEHAYKEGFRFLLSYIIIFISKCLLIILKSFNIFALPTLVIITLKIWWSYSEVKGDEIEMESIIR